MENNDLDLNAMLDTLVVEGDTTAADQTETVVTSETTEKKKSGGRKAVYSEKKNIIADLLLVKEGTKISQPRKMKLLEMGMINFEKSAVQVEGKRGRKSYVWSLTAAGENLLNSKDI